MSELSLKRQITGLHMTDPEAMRLIGEVQTACSDDCLLPEVDPKTGICTGVWLNFGEDDTRNNFNCCSWDGNKPVTDEDDHYEGEFGVSFWKRHIKKLSECGPDEVLLNKVWFISDSFGGWPEGPFRTEQCCINRRDEVYWWEKANPTSEHTLRRQEWRKKAKIWSVQLDHGDGVPTSFVSLRSLYQKYGE